MNEKKLAHCTRCNETKLHFTRKGPRGGQILSLCCDCRREREREVYRMKSKDPAFLQQRAAQRRARGRRGRGKDGTLYYVQNLLAGSRYRAKKRGLKHTLTRDWVLTRLRVGCPITGLPFDFSAPSGRRCNPRAPSVDRIDPSKGYTQENCRLVMNWYNVAKSDYDDQTIFGLMRAAVSRVKEAN